MLWGRGPFIGQVQNQEARFTTPSPNCSCENPWVASDRISIPIGIHGKNGIFTHNFTVDFYCKLVGKYTSPMDGMGCTSHVFQKKELQVSCCRLWLVWEGLLYLLDRIAIDIHHGDGEKKAMRLRPLENDCSVLCGNVVPFMIPEGKNHVRSCDFPV